MSEWIEIEGASKEDAIERACNALNTTTSYLSYQVIGGGGRKIRARKIEEGEAQKAKEKSQPEKPRVETDETETETETDAGDQASDEDDAMETRGNREPESGRSRRRNYEEEEPDEEVEATDVGKDAQETLKTILGYIEEEATVELTERTKSIDLEIKGSGSGLLIGRRGQTLEALQHLVSKVLGLDTRDGKRIAVDSEGYRARRREALEGLARKLASRAKRDGRSMSAEPMNAAERRILHMALVDDSGVSTKSVGEGDGRKVVIVPKRRRSSRGGGSYARGGGGGGRDNGVADAAVETAVDAVEVVKVDVAVDAVEVVKAQEVAEVDKMDVVAVDAVAADHPACTIRLMCHQSHAQIFCRTMKRC